MKKKRKKSPMFELNLDGPRQDFRLDGPDCAIDTIPNQYLSMQISLTRNMMIFFPARKDEKLFLRF